VTKEAVADPAAPQPNRSVLDPIERFSEILFGLIMVLTFTGSLSASGSAPQEVRTMLIGALGCNLAWGIIDAIFYLMTTLGLRSHSVVVLRHLRRHPDRASAHALIAEALPPKLASALRPEDLDLLQERIAKIPLPKGPPLHRADFLAALAVFALVFASTFPVALPFLVMHDAMAALRVSNAIAIALLFLGGYELGKFAGTHPWLTGLTMVAIGAVLVGLTIALGG
jgi:hypothetical protein